MAFAADENASDGDVLEIADSNDTVEINNNENITVVKENNLNTPKTAIQSVKMNGVLKRVNGGVYYSATFYDTSGKLIKNQEMWFTVDTDSPDWGFSVSTDSNGIGILKAALKNGNHKITAYNLETGDNASDNIKVFDVITGGKNINMYYDDGNTYKVRVYDDDGNPVKAGQKVTFYLNNKKSIVKTDKNGYASLKITSKPGYYAVAAQYKDFAVANTVYVKNVLKPASSFKAKRTKPTVTLKIKYLGKNKKNKQIKVKFNKKTYKAKTNKKGIAKFTLKTPKNVGKYPTVVSYKSVKLHLVYSKYYV